MISTWKAVFLCLLLISNVFAQTDFKNTCQTDSLMNLLATGLINMDLIDSFNGGANKDVYRDLSLAKFGKQEVLGHAFALTGFEGPCAQSYYTLVIDKVEFENDNTRMRIVVNYRTTTPGFTPLLTKWTKVSFTYIVVSRSFSGTYSDIWATVAEVQGVQLANANTAPIAVDLIGLAFTKSSLTPTIAACSAYQDSSTTADNQGFNYAINAATCGADANNIANPPTNTPATAGGRLIVHAYIMGFGFDPARTSDRFLAASVFTQQYLPFTGAALGTTFTDVAQLARQNTGTAIDAGDAALGRVTFTFKLPTDVAGVVSGPQVSIFNFNGALQYLKVGFVYTRYNNKLDPAPLLAQLETSTDGARSLYRIPNGYSGGQLQYTSSHVFAQVTTFNTPQNLFRSKIDLSGNWNRLYFTLPDTRYAIYGLSSFDLPKSAINLCSGNIRIDSTLNSINSFTVNTPNAVSTVSNFVFSADIFTVNHFLLCKPAVGDQFVYKAEIGKKSYFTVPTLSSKQFILEIIPVTTIPLDDLFTNSGISPSDPTDTASSTNADKAVHLAFIGAETGTDVDTIQFKAEIPFTGLTPNAPLKFQFGWWTPTEASTDAGTNEFLDPPFNSLNRMQADKNYSIKFSVNGLQMYKIVHVGKADDAKDLASKIFRGITINSATATVTIQISFPRSGSTTTPMANPFTDPEDIAIFTYVRLSQYLRAYDPATGCCVASCPANTGLSVVIDPPTCVVCDTQAGLVYNPSVGSCTCLKGYYLDATKTFQCYPCTALYCDVCSATTPATCITCATGAVSNTILGTCSCTTGYYATGTTCTVCPIACQTCSAPTGTCLTCVNADLRDLSRNCQCIDGYFHNNQVNCVKCSSTCATCQSASACITCPANSNRVLQGNVCTCIAGFYELYNADQSRTCQRCNPECLTCNVSPANCLSCDPAKNRVSGVNQYGNPTCLCNPGFYSTEDGSCIQSNCNADPFCSQCEQGLKLCIQCLASRNRIIKLPESICVCMDGFYPDANNNCVPCSSGCLICRSATVCSSCVALANPSTASAGQCVCPQRTFFTVSTSGTRYCANCGSHCLACSSETACTTCQNSFTLLSSGSCQCPNRFFVNSAANCVPCAQGCDICTSNTVCTQCISPLLLQGNVCQANCNNGFTPLGGKCVGCPAGCLQCTQNLICFYCADNLFIYKGSCFEICPAGTIGDRSSGNWQCIPCNSPCKTCMNHPSYCTSCENGKGYLQTSAVQQSCVAECTDGTYVKNGVCQVCDFSCATCLGAASNCISCPNGQTLYNGGCWARCPAILISGTGSGNVNLCVQNCPDGFFKISESECSPCAPQCTTCSNTATNCTSCLQGSVTLAGTCSVKCGQNEMSFAGICISCSKSCYGCSFTPTNCDECAEGYVLSGSICQKGCLKNQFFDNNRRVCANCPTGCASCTSTTNCTTCTNPSITPRGGVCANCPYPCATCDATGTCNTCLSGFSFFQGACQQRCPAGSSPVNGVCVCNSGVVANGRCVASCQNGFTPVNGNCVPCNQNCAQCSGSANTCTSCISGFAVDVISQTCVAATQCNYGQQFDNGNCENICPGGYYYYESLCIFGGCFDGYEPSAFGGCVRKASSSASSGNCEASQFRLNGLCVQDCGTGYYPDFVNGVCSSCSSNCASCFNNNYCVNCLSGFQNTNGACVQATACSSNQLQYGNACVSSCPVGAYQTGSQCVRSCPPETYYNSQICWISCPSGLLRTADACVNTCPAGTANRNGICS